jgi:hypothetical protein
VQFSYVHPFFLMVIFLSIKNSDKATLAVG